MPPQAKFKKEEILDMAFCITKEQGIDALTARELGRRLGSSARPIFTVFESMEEVRLLVISQAKALYAQYVEEGLKTQIPFKGVGISYIRFAMEEPLLFRLLFMTPPKNTRDISDILPVIDDNYSKILRSVQEPYGLNQAQAERIYQHLWTYTHGIAAMSATGLCRYAMEEIEERMTEVFIGLLTIYKGKKSGVGKENEHDKHPKHL